MSRLTEAIATELTKNAVDKGLVIELGWIAMLKHAIPQDISDEEVAKFRQAYFMGAQHLYASIMGILDPGREPTAKDMRRMELIHRELERFRAHEMSRRHEAPERKQ